MRLKFSIINFEQSLNARNARVDNIYIHLTENIKMLEINKNQIM
jgi:hypothetical protein